MNTLLKLLKMLRVELNNWYVKIEITQVRINNLLIVNLFRRLFLSDINFSIQPERGVYFCYVNCKNALQMMSY